MNEAYKELDKNLAFILLPLLWPYDKNSTLIDRKKLLNCFVYGLVISSLILLLIATFNSFDVTGGKLSFDSRILKDNRIDFATSIIWGGNHFFSSGLSVFIHPTYLTMYLVLAIFVILESTNGAIRTHYFRYAIIGLFIIMIYLLASRAGFLVLVSTFLLYIIWRFKKNFTGQRTVIALLAFLVITIGLTIVNPRLNDLLSKIRKEGFTLNPEATYSYGSRLLTWSSGLELIKQNPVFGVGAGDSEDVLMDYYYRHGYKACYERKYNVHNQYLETWVAVGIPGVLILLMMLGEFLVIFFRRDDVLPVLFIVIFISNSLFESTFDRYSGVVFFIFFYCLFYTRPSVSSLMAERQINEILQKNTQEGG